MSREFEPGDGDQCNDCGEYCQLDAYCWVCADCFDSYGYGDQADDDEPAP